MILQCKKDYQKLRWKGVVTDTFKDFFTCFPKGIIQRLLYSRVGYTKMKVAPAEE